MHCYVCNPSTFKENAVQFNDGQMRVVFKTSNVQPSRWNNACIRYLSCSLSDCVCKGFSPQGLRKGTEVKFARRGVLHRPANLHPGFATVTLDSFQPAVGIIITDG